MGLIKAAGSAISGTLKDQWKEAIRCEDMGNDILMMKKTTSTGVITNKSTIIVAPGQCAIIYDNGRVIDATAEEGFYEFNDSSSPTFFAGQFGATFKEMWQRFTFNGASSKQQAVFFFNIKEITDNKFGTQTPIPYQDWLHSMLNEMNGKLTPLSINIRCRGLYSFRITDPALFMNRIAGTADVFYKKDLIEGQMRSEVIGVLQNLLNELGGEKKQISPLMLPSQTDEIKETMDKMVFDQPIRDRGLSICSFVIESVSPDEESQKKIDDYELSANASMRKGRLTADYGEAVKNAAKNSAGAANGFMGIGMMNMSSGGAMGNVAQGVWQDTTPNVNNTQVTNEQKDTEKKEVTGWTCPNCNEPASGNFCTNCGCKKPETPAKKFCGDCGAELGNNAKFCPECGTKVE